MENNLIKLELSIDHINVILNTLSDGAFRVVQPVIATIQEQAAPQVNPAPVEPEAPAKGK